MLPRSLREKSFGFLGVLGVSAVKTVFLCALGVLGGEKLLPEACRGESRKLELRLHSAHHLGHE